jgi:3-oxoadipate enol-lactonase
VSGTNAPDAYVDDLAALIDELGLGQVTLVAQSMGGWTCLGYALREPAKVRALVMACTAGPINCSQLAAEKFKDWLAHSQRISAELEAKDSSVASGERMESEQPALARLYRQIMQLTPADFRAAVRVRLRELWVQDPALLGSLTMPVLFLNGEEDWVFPPFAGAALAALAPKGKAVRVPRAGHSVYFERAAEFNRIVDEFLSTT